MDEVKTQRKNPKKKTLRPSQKERVFVDGCQKLKELKLLNHRDRREHAAVDDFLNDARKKIRRETANDLVKGPLIPELSHHDPIKNTQCSFS